MRNWLIYKLGGVPKESYYNLYDTSLELMSMYQSLEEFIYYKVKHRYPKGHEKAGKFCTFDEFIECVTKKN